MDFRKKKDKAAYQKYRKAQIFSGIGTVMGFVGFGPFYGGNQSNYCEMVSISLGSCEWIFLGIGLIGFFLFVIGFFQFRSLLEKK